MKIEGKTVLVTGADGFIGSHLTELLLSKGCRVRALSYYNSFNYWGWLEEIPQSESLEVVSGDIRDPHFVDELVQGVDVVFHLAALIAIPFSYRAPDSYIDTNIKGTLNVCQAALRHQVQKVIHTSTSEVYGTAQYVPIDEKHPLQPQSPYSASKIGADSIAMSFYYSFQLPLTIARPFNTYGPRQSARAVIPTIITQLAAGAKEIKLGDLRPTRDFNFVKDTCKGMILLAEGENTDGEVFNIGSDAEISIGELAQKIMDLMGVKANIVSETQRLRPKDSEVLRLRCNNQKIRQAVQFKPDFTLDEGLKITIDWFTKKENLAKYKSDIYNV
ncbi:NAD-dependent epimerase/dehydratase [Caldithrix abyssi DSM 13497]|uniref:NAD dependent epimerase/dehydratase, LLPSF_EDH_00030 family n=1 Tax=Caldithrix abyssi DSM 13497 TaxID=880073 RepID=H1XRB8_CALAY|nr:NAD-dependent 4,6-dehydratase LegB [Caldithrix abyssi]APF18388.1 NAD dependent epimerase/dehydratase, LLPSF_EDH_00030 family [Caldithrix abyssi DSM 13497]EHO42399.1 NAD-dependent epimerase/dehydratase [Caldithrix abyssi DSM 13497]